MITARSREAFLWLRRQTPIRLINAAQAHVSYWRAQRYGPDTPSFMPVSVSVEPTTSCNLRCPQCPSGLRSFSRPTGQLDENLFLSVLEELHPWLSNLTLYFQGEPFLHPAFVRLVEHASRRNVYTRTSTNGHYLTSEKARDVVKSGLDHIVISVDGVTQEVYEQYRKGGRLDRVLDGIRNLVEARRILNSWSPYIQLQFLILGPNESQIPAMRELAQSCGVDEVRFKSAQVYDFENGSEWIPSSPDFARYHKDGDRWKIKSDLDNRCWRMWSGSVMTWDGRVIPCCFDKDARHTMGVLPETTFREIWTGASYQQFRESIFRNRGEIDMCRNCTEGLSLNT